jgi:Spx/MgsR family transcriptional regulator
MTRQPRIVFYHKQTCTTCRKAKVLLNELQLEVVPRDLDKERLSESDLDNLIGMLDHTKFLNARNELYRSCKMAEQTPDRAQAVKLMAQEPNLIRRPLLAFGSQVIIGLDESAYRRLCE